MKNIVIIVFTPFEVSFKVTQLILEVERNGPICIFCIETILASHFFFNALISLKSDKQISSLLKTFSSKIFTPIAIKQAPFFLLPPPLVPKK